MYLLEKYNKIWDKISNSTKKEFDSELVYTEKYLQTQTKFYEDGGILQDSPHFICLWVILIDSVLKICKKLLPSSVFRRK